MFLDTWKIIISLLYLSSLGGILTAQDQRIADSLRIIYEEVQLSGEAQLDLLRNLAFHESQDFQLALRYANELIELSRRLNNKKYLYHGHVRKGGVYLQMGDPKEALESFILSAKTAMETGFKEGEGGAYISIADTYASIGNTQSAEEYYIKAIDILQETKDSVTLATVYLNAGDMYFNTAQYDQALDYFQSSGNLFKALNYTIGEAYNLGNVGMVYTKLDQNDLAEQNLDAAITILEELGDTYGMATYLEYKSDIYLDRKETAEALTFARQSLEMAAENDMKEQIRDSHLQLSEIFGQAGESDSSFHYYRNYVAYRDSITNLESVQSLADLRTEFEVSQKQLEVDLLNQQKRNQQLVVLIVGIALALIIVLAVGLYRRNQFISKTSKIIETEKERSDKLLLNILPEEVANELKDRGKVSAKRFESVSVLFSDFKGFTSYAENLPPEKLVDCVDYYFSEFDRIIEKHGVEKIKTVGDAYMCAAGLPIPSQQHAEKMVEAGLEILDFVNQAKENAPAGIPRFDIRIGINSGPVVAGVVGSKKFAFDIWGDAVNIASRMESNSEPGKLNISEYTYQLIKDKYKCSYRGEIQAKNRGALKMYFVENVKEAVSV